MTEYYIYIARQFNEIVYVGRGVENRYKHITSGTSSCYDANKEHFLNPNTVSVNVEFVSYDYEEIKEIEDLLIRTLQPKWNKHNKKELETRSKPIPQMSQVELKITKLLSVPLHKRLERDIIATVLTVKSMSIMEYLTLAGLDEKRFISERRIMLQRLNLNFK